MKSTLFIILTIAVIALVESSLAASLRNSELLAPHIHSSPLPTSRLKRSADPGPQGSFSADLQRNSLNLGYRHNIFDNNRGSLTATAGAMKVPGQSWTSSVGVQGTYRFPQPDPRGSISASWQKNLNGPERRPSYGLGYEHTIFQNRHGSIGVTAGAQKFPGRRWESNVGIGGRFRFRRSAGKINQRE